MCQLTLVNLVTNPPKVISPIFAAIAAVNNSHLNSDGTGVFEQNMGVWKSEKAGFLLPNLGAEMATRNIGCGPVMLHVRAASGTLANKHIDTEHAHPFEGENFVLMHNGTLKPKDKEKNKLPDGMIDSQYFHSLLEAARVEAPEKGILPLLTETMSLFTGKFAFLIYDKRDKIFYVARGKTAQLHYLHFNIDEMPGIVVNTSKEDLEKNTIQTMSIFPLIGVKTATVVEKITPIPEESVFLLKNGRLDKVGELKENEEPVKTYAGYGSSVYGGYEDNYDDQGYWRGYSRGGVSNVSNKKAAGEDEPFATLIDLFLRLRLSLWEIDRISFLLYNHGVYSLSPTEITGLEVSLKAAESRYLSKKVRRLWNACLSHGSVIKLYQRGIKFPYFLNTIQELRNLKITLDEEGKAKGKEVTVDPELEEDDDASTAIICG